METEIYKKTEFGEYLVGIIADDAICTIMGRSRRVVGTVGPENTIYRKTAHSEQELGRCTATGEIFSNGLFEGGAMGWLDDDGVVVQGGLIFSEEEVGRVSGPAKEAGAAALLLLLLPADAEEERKSKR